MERIDVSEVPRLADLVAAAERGEDVEIIRDGSVVAQVRAKSWASLIFPHSPPDGPKPIDLAAFDALHARFPELRVDSAAALIREQRDLDD